MHNTMEYIQNVMMEHIQYAKMKNKIYNMKKFKVPIYAKIKAKKALKLRSSLPESRKFGLNKEEANNLGINSGVERAKQLIRSKSISLKDAKRVCAFYNRFKNCKTFKCEGSHDLWGGRKFERKVCKELR